MRNAARNLFSAMLMVGVSGIFSLSQCVPPTKPAASAASSESSSATTKAADSGAQEPAVYEQKPAADAKAAKDSPKTQDQGKPQKPNKKDKKKKDKKSQDDLGSSVFSAAAAQDTLSLIRDGLEGHSQRLMLSAFDEDKMDGYLAFEDQLQAFFNKYEGFTVHFRIAQTTAEGSKGIALVDIEMEEIPRGGAAPPNRRHAQMRFELERGRKGWRVVDFRPRGFFS